MPVPIVASRRSPPDDARAASAVEGQLDDVQAMTLALELATHAAALGEVPVGAVVLDAEGHLLGSGHNRTIMDHDPTAHAEVVAMRAAALKTRNYRLPGARLFVTLEPCAMCLGAMFHARVAEIVYGASDPKTGACGGALDLATQIHLNHHARLRGGLMADASSRLLQAFFRARRRLAKAPSSQVSKMKSSHDVDMKSPHDVDCNAAHAKPGVHQAPDGIYIISPSGAVGDPARLAVAAQRLRALGFHVATDRSARAVHERFAGTDRQRLAAIGRAVRQDRRIVMATRGGYGLSRLLSRIDWPAVADSGKLFVGHSDFTAFNLALLARTGAVSLTGPNALYDFGGDTVDELTQALFQEFLDGQLEILSFEAPEADPVDARGILWGGNLAMVASLAGTPYLPAVDGGILFLEDVSEHPFRVERMLTQLWYAGVLERQRAILLGHFTQYRLGPQDNGYDLPAVVHWLRKTVRVPVVTGLPYGHVPTKATLPIGARVGIATEHGMAYLVLREHQHHL